MSIFCFIQVCEVEVGYVVMNIFLVVLKVCGCGLVSLWEDFFLDIVHCLGKKNMCMGYFS